MICGVGLAGRDLSSTTKGEEGCPATYDALTERSKGEGARRRQVSVLSGAALDELEPASGRLPPVLVVCGAATSLPFARLPTSRTCTTTR